MAPSRPSGTGRSASSEGFTLIEVLIAVAILGVSLAVILSGFSTSLDRMQETRDRTAALALAQSLMDRVGVDLPMSEGRREGTSEDGRLAWRIESESYGSDADRDAWPAEAYEVAASVSWQDGAESIELRSLKVGRKQQ